MQDEPVDLLFAEMAGDRWLLVNFQLNIKYVTLF